jgi:LysM repeat protein
MLKHNDVYLDDLELVAVSIPGGAAAPAPVAAPTQAPVAANAGPPPSAPQPRPPPSDGAVVHVVQPGDTVWGLSVQYDVSMDQILRLNGMNQDTPLLIGQEVVIAVPEATSPPAPAPTETPATATEIAALNTGELCVSAFTDSNGDNVMDPDENLVGGVVFVLQNTQAIAATRTTDGLSEPYCFVQPAGAYSLLIQVPAGRVATSDTRWGLVLAPGTPVNINFGSQPAAGVSSVTARSAPENGLGKALSGLAGIVLVIVAAAGMFWVLRERFARGGRL